MADIIVDPGGGEDYTTIQDACDNASAGDVIKVNTGTYNENVNIDTVDGTSGSRITLQANTGQTPTMSPGSGAQLFLLSGKDYWTFDFDGWVFTPTANMNFFMYTSPAGNVNVGITIKNVTSTDTNIQRWFGAITAGVHVNNLTIQDCVVKNIAVDGVFVGSNGRYDGTLIERCWFDNLNSNRYGVVFYTSGAANHTVTVRNCIFSDVGGALFDGNNNNNMTLNFYNNTTYLAAADGMYLNSGTRASTYNIKNNIFSEIGDYGIDDPNTSATYNIDYNCWYNTTTGDIRNESIGGNAQSGDPGMTAPGSDDFTLSGSGLADDTGVDLSGTGFTDDYAGTTRAQGGGSDAWDIGALDYIGVVSTPKHGFINFQDPAIA